MIRKLFIVVLVTAANLFAQPVCTKTDTLLFLDKIKFMFENQFMDKDLSVAEMTYQIGTSFIGTEYVAGTLDKNLDEELVINLGGLDCYTFVETSLSLARMAESGEYNFENFVNEVKDNRYRGGVMGEYPTRLHYFTEWIMDMEERGKVKDVTESVGGEVYTKHVNFMSKNSDKYKQLKANPEFVDAIKKAEDRINSQVRYYIPQEKISEFEKGIKQGDIIALTTGIKGLDIVHVGLAAEVEGRIHFMHAPNVGYKVQISENPLADYVKGNKSQTGVMVVRPE